MIVTRDRRRMLEERALRSALRQEGVEYEVIVVDDGSTDDTAAFLASLEEPRLRFLRRSAPGGMAAARNQGIAAARGRWIAFLDDDDMWSPRKLERQLDAARQAAADWVYAGAVAIDDRGIVLDMLYLPPPTELRTMLAQAAAIPAGASNVLVRTELVRSLGGFDETFVHIADWDLWLRLADVAPAAVCREILVAYLLHPGNIHAVDDPATEIDALIEKHAAAVSPRVISPDRAGYARWVAGQRSRAGRHGEAARMYFRSSVRYRSPGDFIRAADALFGKRISSWIRHVSGRKQPVDPPPPSLDWLTV